MVEVIHAAAIAATAAGVAAGSAGRGAQGRGHSSQSRRHGRQGGPPRPSIVVTTVPDIVPVAGELLGRRGRLPSQRSRHCPTLAKVMDEAATIKCGGHDRRVAAAVADIVATAADVFGCGGRLPSR